MAAQCVQNAKYVDPSLVDDLIVLALTEFKYGLEELGEQEVVAYDLIRTMHIISDKKSKNLSQRITDDMSFFINKYHDAIRFHTVIPDEEISSADLIHSIQEHENPSLEGDYLWSLGVRKAREAISLVKTLVQAKDYQYRNEAIWALGEICNTEDTSVFLACLNNEESTQVVAAICNALIRSHKRETKEKEGDTLDHELAIRHLINFVDNLTNPAREAAGWALYNLAGIKAKDTYIKHMSTGTNYYQRAMFVYLVGELGIEEAIGKLVEMYPQEIEAHVREDIIFSLGAILDSLRKKNNSIITLTDTVTLEKVTDTLLAGLSDIDSVVRMQAVIAFGKLQIAEFLPHLRKLFTDPSSFVSKTAQQVVDQLEKSNSPQQNIQGVQEMSEREKQLIRYSANATALASRLRELDIEYNKGRLDIGRFTQLKTSIETERLELLSEISLTIQGTQMQVVGSAIQIAMSNNGGNDEQVRENLRVVVKDQGWGDILLEKINTYKGEIVSLIITVALEIAKQTSLK